MINAYVTAMMKQKFDTMGDEYKTKKQDDRYSTARQQAIANMAEGQTLEEGFGSTGKTFKVNNAPKPSEMEKMLGTAPRSYYDAAVKNANLKKEMLPPEQTPGSMMSLPSGDVGDINAQPLPLQEEPSVETFKRYVAGSMSPMARAARTEDLNTPPEELKSDLENILSSSQGDEDVLLDNLAELKVKHINNKYASSKIEKMISEQIKNKAANKKGSSTSDSAMSRLRSGG